MRAVVDAQPVGVELVEQVTGLARVEPLTDHRGVGDGVGGGVGVAQRLVGEKPRRPAPATDEKQERLTVVSPALVCSPVCRPVRFPGGSPETTDKRRG
jgi:hypothetical protein